MPLQQTLSAADHARACAIGRARYEFSGYARPEVHRWFPGHARAIEGSELSAVCELAVMRWLGQAGWPVVRRTRGRMPPDVVLDDGRVLEVKHNARGVLYARPAPLVVPDLYVLAEASRLTTSVTLHAWATREVVARWGEVLPRAPSGDWAIPAHRLTSL